MKHEMTQENATCCSKSACKCPITGLPIHKVIFGAIMLTLFGLTAWNTVKINKIFSAQVAQYGNEANMNEYLKITQTTGFINNVKQGLDGLKAQVGLSTEVNSEETDTTETTTEETGDTKTVQSTEVVNTNVANGDAKWAANGKEAFTYFGLQGTPGNVVLNTKTGNYKAIGGAYPKDVFEKAVATIKAGEAQSDEAGQAGTLTQEQIAALLKGAYYYKNEGAEIVIVEYSDLLCPYCQRHFDNKTIESIVDADATVALVFKNNPIAQLHPTAPIGAKGAECAGQLGGSKAFYNFIAKGFTYSTFNNDNVTEIATSIGLDKAQFVACLNK